jgi:hypothetical protein
MPPRSFARVWGTAGGGEGERAARSPARSLGGPICRRLPARIRRNSTFVQFPQSTPKFGSAHYVTWDQRSPGRANEATAWQSDKQLQS